MKKTKVFKNDALNFLKYYDRMRDEASSDYLILDFKGNTLFQLDFTVMKSLQFINNIDFYNSNIDNCKILHSIRFSNVSFKQCVITNSTFKIVFNNVDFTRTHINNVSFEGCVFKNCTFTYAKFIGVDFFGASFVNCIGLDTVYVSTNTRFFNIVCPEKGSFIGYKNCAGLIVELLIPEDAKRSSATTTKCRCSKAKILSITHIDGSPSKFTEIPSNYDVSFKYKIGETVEVNNFNKDRWNECSAGIHFFINRSDAVNY